MSGELNVREIGARVLWEKGYVRGSSPYSMGEAPLAAMDAVLAALTDNGIVLASGRDQAGWRLPSGELRGLAPPWGVDGSDWVPVYVPLAQNEEGTDARTDG